MQPTPSLMSQLTSGMAQGSSPMNVLTPGSPNFDPSLTPQGPTPSPNQHLHMAIQRRASGQSSPPPPDAQQMAQNAPNMAPQGQVTMPPVQDVNPQSPGTQIPLSEVELIIKALSTHLTHRNKLEAKVLEAALAQHAAENGLNQDQGAQSAGQ